MTRWTVGVVLVTGLWGCGHVEAEDDTPGTRNSPVETVAGAGGNNDAPTGTGGSTNSCGAGPLPYYGTAGSGEVPGTGGAVGTGGAGPVPGTGGSAGAPFGAMCEPSSTFATECSVEETCRLVGCGDGISRFDAQGCNRECQSSAQCGAGERCRFTGLALDVDCGAPSEIEGCWIEDSACVCSETADCGFADVCVDAAKYPVELDCDVAAVSCKNGLELVDFRLTVGTLYEESPERAAAIEACRPKVLTKLEELGCPYVAPAQP